MQSLNAGNFTLSLLDEFRRVLIVEPGDGVVAEGKGVGGHRHELGLRLQILLDVPALNWIARSLHRRARSVLAGSNGGEELRQTRS